MPGGDRAGGRRGRRTTPQPVTLEDVAAQLARGRAAAGLGLADVADRTGVSAAEIEALESGHLGPFPTERSAVSAARRLAELVGADAGTAMAATADRWRTTNGPAPGSAAVTPVAAHLSRFPGDTSHLTPFTRTGEFPAVGRAVPAAPPTSTGVLGAVHTGPHTGTYPTVPPLRRPVRPPAPLLLRLALGLAALLVVLAAAGLVAHHYRPQWLADLHLVPGHGGSGRGGTTTSEATHGAGATVTATPGGSAASTVTVHASAYQVQVAALQAAWVQVTTPGNPSPVFAGVLSPNETQTFDAPGGQLSVEFGGAQVLVAVKVDGKIVPGWLFKPPVVPYTLTFARAG